MEKNTRPTHVTWSLADEEQCTYHFEVLDWRWWWRRATSESLLWRVGADSDRWGSQQEPSYTCEVQPIPGKNRLQVQSYERLCRHYSFQNLCIPLPAPGQLRAVRIPKIIAPPCPCLVSPISFSEHQPHQNVQSRSKWNRSNTPECGPSRRGKDQPYRNKICTLSWGMTTLLTYSNWASQLWVGLELALASQPVIMELSISRDFPSRFTIPTTWYSIQVKNGVLTGALVKVLFLCFALTVPFSAPLPALLPAPHSLPAPQNEPLPALLNEVRWRKRRGKLVGVTAAFQCSCLWTGGFLADWGATHESHELACPKWVARKGSPENFNLFLFLASGNKKVLNRTKPALQKGKNST